jgi:hypothetical protein
VCPSRWQRYMARRSPPRGVRPSARRTPAPWRAGRPAAGSSPCRVRSVAGTGPRASAPSTQGATPCAVSSAPPWSPPP